MTAMYPSTKRRVGKQHKSKHEMLHFDSQLCNPKQPRRIGDIEGKLKGGVFKWTEPNSI